MEDAVLRQDMKDLELCKRIVKTLSGDGRQRVLLIGKSGIGKTWLANKVGEHATKEGLCYLTLWLHLNNKFEDEMSLYENIAFQLEVYDREEMEEKKSEALLKDLKEKISTEISRKKKTVEEKMKMLLTEKNAKLAKGVKKHTSSALMMPYLLLILDDEGNMTGEDKVMKGLGLGSVLKHDLNLKVLITRREGGRSITEYDEEAEPRDPKSEEEIKPQDTRSEEVTEAHTIYTDTKLHGKTIEFHTTDESQALLDTLIKETLQSLFESLLTDEARDLLKSLEKDWKIDEPLISRVVQKSMSLPAAVIVFAKSLNYTTNTFKKFSRRQDEILKEVLFPCGPAYSISGSESSTKPCQYNPLLQLAYMLLETDSASKNVIVDCFWHSLDFSKHCGCVYFCDLITQWILEGYFDPVRSVKKAYKDGHDILVEFINRGILKIQEDGMVIPEMAMSNLTDLQHPGILSRSQLRFAKVYGGDKKKGLGRITQIDDMIKTVHAERGYKTLTILVSGNRLRRETPMKFFQQMCDLEVLGLFSPTVEPLIPSIKNLKKLRVLVIRDCDSLSDIEELKCISGLNVLEVSGASSLRVISDEFFLALPELQSLNLSGSLIKRSPSSISQLKNLCSLILRDCLVLEDLPDIRELYRLEVVDVRGACKLKSVFGKECNTSRNRTLSYLQQLQLLDFSESKISRLPVFHDAVDANKLHSLTRLSLHNCSNLIKLPNLKPLSALQILDLSGTNSLVEIAEVCFEQKEELKILNLSGTKFTKLPSTISGLSNLSQLLLRDSSNIEILPNIKGLTSLEVLDVSGCAKLHKIEGSFKEMSYLREVNLDSTSIASLPELPEKSNIFCSKLVVLADSRRLIHDTWSQVKEAISNGMSESLSSSDTVNAIQEISRKKTENMDELWAFDCPEKKCHRREHLYQNHIYRDVYAKTIPFVDTKSYQEILEIRRSNGVVQDKETLARAKFVVFVDNSTTSISSIYKDLYSVEGCWLEMCGDIGILFFGVDEERLGYLETLSITNLPLLESIRSSSFKNLKKLNLDCCQRIKTVFPASVRPTSLEVLKIKFCEVLEKVFEEEVEVPNLHTLCLFQLPMLSAINAMLPNLETYKEDKCPKLKTSKEDLRGLDWVKV